MDIANVHIIHDKRSEERSRLMAQTIHEQKMQAIIWPSVYGSIAEAHKQIVRYAIALDLPEIVIAEDDVFFYAPDGFQYFLDNKPDDFDLYLSGVYHSIPELPTKDNIIKRFAGLHLYIVAKRFYRQFLSLKVDAMNSIDNALSLLGCYSLAKYKVCYPYAAVQREELPSTNPLLYGNIYKHKYYFNSKNCYGYKQGETHSQ